VSAVCIRNISWVQVADGYCSASHRSAEAAARWPSTDGGQALHTAERLPPRPPGLPRAERAETAAASRVAAGRSHLPRRSSDDRAHSRLVRPPWNYSDDYCLAAFIGVQPCCRPTGLAGVRVPPEAGGWTPSWTPHGVECWRWQGGPECRALRQADGEPARRFEPIGGQTSGDCRGQAVLADSRLVTLTGRGWCRQDAVGDPRRSQVRSAFSDGVCLVTLADLRRGTAAHDGDVGPERHRFGLGGS